MIKFCFAAVFVIFSVLMFGCYTQQLSLETHGEQLAPALGVDESEVQFLGRSDIRAKIEKKAARSI